MMTEFLAMLTDPELGAVNFTVERVTSSIDNKGRAKETAETHVAQGSVQPATGKERELLPEGERTSETIAVYTPFALRMNDEGNVKADIIISQGKRYRVAMVQPWVVNGKYAYSYALAIYAGERDA